MDFWDKKEKTQFINRFWDKETKKYIKYGKNKKKIKTKTNKKKEK